MRWVTREKISLVERSGRLLDAFYAGVSLPDRSVQMTHEEVQRDERTDRGS